MNHENDRTAADIERDIEQTRERVTRDIDALGEKLSPENLKQQAKDAIADKAHEVAKNVGEQARETGSRVAEFIGENPLPIVAVGLGAVWLLTQRNRSEISGDRMARFAYTGPERRGHSPGNGVGRRLADRAGQVKEALGGKAHDVAERAGELRHEAADRMQALSRGARQQARRARRGIEHASEENPLAVVAGAAILGLILGFLIPRTRRGRRLMGAGRDDLAERAQEVGQRVKDAALDAGPELKATLADAAHAVGEQIKESASEVAEEAKDAVRTRARGRGPGTG
jgi:ElaB/YqjD/DUF883 family membrane-anchored ribosome-binding protein